MDNKKQTANDFWQQLLSQAKDAATTAVEMAEDGISYAKTSRSVKELQAEIDRQMKTLGELLYATHKGTPSGSSYIQEVLEYVDNLQDQRRGLLRHMKLLRGILLCPQCECENDISNDYCQDCGHRLLQD